MKYTSQSGIIKKSIRNTKSFQPVQQLAGFVASIPLPVKNSQAVLDGWLKNPPWNITGGMVPLKSTRSIYLSIYLIYLSISIYLYEYYQQEYGCLCPSFPEALNNTAAFSTRAHGGTTQPCQVFR
jgi:hypothetical protein